MLTALLRAYKKAVLKQDEEEIIQALKNLERVGMDKVTADALLDELS